MFYKFTLKNYRSMLTNLNDALLVDVKMGRADGDIIEKNGKKLVKISPDKLTELF